MITFKYNNKIFKGIVKGKRGSNSYIVELINLKNYGWPGKCTTKAEREEFHLRFDKMYLYVNGYMIISKKNGGFKQLKLE